MDTNANLSGLLRERAATLGSREWVVDVEGGSASFAEIDARATAVARSLSGAGYVPGSRILVLAGNSLDFIAVLFGIVRAGCVVVPVNTALSGAMLAHICRDADASLLFADEAGSCRFAEIGSSVPKVDRILRIDRADGANSLGELEQAGALHRFVEPESDPGSIAAILYTSGTTGPSKGVMLPQAHLYQNAWLYVREMRLETEDVVYCSLPMFHLNGLTLQLYASLLVGCPITFRRHFSAGAWIEDIRRSGATVTNMLGSMAEFVLALPPRPNDIDNRLRHIVSVPTQKTLCERFEARFGVRLIELYGMTEITCPLYMPLDGPRRPGSCGRLLADRFEARIVDPGSDIDVLPGGVGELVVRPLHPYGFMAGYFRNPEATVLAWRNLWFHTGDAMRVDSEGYFYFVDRLKDCVRRRGENVSTFEVEQALLDIDEVQEIAVVGIASPFSEGEQEIKAYIVARGALEPSDVHRYAISSLPQFAIPRVIEFVSSLPKTGTGKVEKRTLRESGVTEASWLAPDITRQRKLS